MATPPPQHPPPLAPARRSSKTNRQIESKAERDGDGTSLPDRTSLPPCTPPPPPPPRGTRDEPSAERQADHEKQREEQRVAVSLERQRSRGWGGGSELQTEAQSDREPPRTGETLTTSRKHTLLKITHTTDF